MLSSGAAQSSTWPLPAAARQATSTTRASTVSHCPTGLKSCRSIHPRCSSWSRTRASCSADLSTSSTTYPRAAQSSASLTFTRPSTPGRRAGRSSARRPRTPSCVRANTCGKRGRSSQTGASCAGQPACSATALPPSTRTKRSIPRRSCSSTAASGLPWWPRHEPYTRSSTPVRRETRFDSRSRDDSSP